MTWTRLRGGVAALVVALTVAFLGVGAIAPETAQAVGVVVEHRTYGAPALVPDKAKDDGSS
jgi:hypothetical protein